MPTLKIQDILRAQDIKRWTIVRTVRQQSLAEHTFNVVMVARAIAKKANLSDVSIIKYALEHDLDEILTGDIPSPTKRRAKSLGVELSTLESSPQNLKGLSNAEYQTVKAADLIENLWFLKEHGVGRHATEECELLKKIVTDHITSIDFIVGKAAFAVQIEVMTGGFFRHE